MKKQIILAALTVLISGSVALAQEQAPVAQKQHKLKAAQHQTKHGNMMEEMKQELDLTDDQVAKIKAIHSESNVVRPEKGQQLSDDQKAANRAAHKEEMAKVRAVLTPDQQVKYDAMIAERKEAKQGKMQRQQH